MLRAPVDDADFQIENTKIQTTDASAPILWNKTVPSGGVIRLRVQIMGVKSDSTQRATYTRECTVYDSSGTATLGGAVVNPAVDYKSDGALTDPVVSVTGATIQVLAGGKAATTYNWRARVEMLQG